MMFVRVLQNDQSEIVADKFWYREEAIKAIANPHSRGYSPSTLGTTFVSDGASSQCRQEYIFATIEGRKLLLKSTMHIVSEAASESTSRTKSILAILTDALKKLGMNEAHELMVKLMDGQQANNIGSNLETQNNNSSTVLNQENAAILLAANPPVKGRFQNQRRKQPLSCNPTSLSYKRKAREHLQEKTNKKNSSSLPT
jgi:hypothetical protein